MKWNVGGMLTDRTAYLLQFTGGGSPSRGKEVCQEHTAHWEPSLGPSPRLLGPGTGPALAFSLCSFAQALFEHLLGARLCGTQ